MPEATHDDTEVVTNFALSAIRADSRVFAFALGLDATPSNNVEVAFGHDTDGDGKLSRSEAMMLVGWKPLWGHSPQGLSLYGIKTK